MYYLKNYNTIKYKICIQYLKEHLHSTYILFLMRVESSDKASKRKSEVKSCFI